MAVLSIQDSNITNNTNKILSECVNSYADVNNGNTCEIFIDSMKDNIYHSDILLTNNNNLMITLLLSLDYNHSNNTVIQLVNNMIIGLLHDDSNTDYYVSLTIAIEDKIIEVIDSEKINNILAIIRCLLSKANSDTTNYNNNTASYSTRLDVWLLLNECVAKAILNSITRITYHNDSNGKCSSIDKGPAAYNSSSKNENNDDTAISSSNILHSYVQYENLGKIAMLLQEIIITINNAANSNSCSNNNGSGSSGSIVGNINMFTISSIGMPEIAYHYYISNYCSRCYCYYYSIIIIIS